MKKLIILINVLLVAFFAKAQTTPYPGKTGYAINQSIGSDSAAVNSKGMLSGRLVVYRFTDTTAANLQRIKNYPGAFIFTTDSSKLWVRDKYAVQWLSAGGSGTGGSISSVTFLTDSSVVVCYENGACDTIPVYNFPNNIININDSTILICTGAGSCDTIHLGNSNNFSVFYDSTTNNYYAVTCDTVQTICSTPYDCYDQQVCDTILIPAIVGTLYQNGVQKLFNTNIVEFGSSSDGEQPGQLIHDTYLFTGAFGNQFSISGRPVGRPPLVVRQYQSASNSASVLQINHQGTSYPGLTDSNNPVSMYFNYTDRFAIPISGAFAGDTIGFFGERYGYFIGTNMQGGGNNIIVNDVNAKQGGVYFDTYTPDNKGVGIFAQQTPSSYSFGGAVDSTLESKVGLWVKTNQQIQLPKYGVGTFTANPSTISGWDSQGNFIEIDTTDIGGSVTFIDSTKIIICAFGDNLCDTVYTTTYINNLIGSGAIYAQNGLTALNDSTVELFGTLGTPATLLNDRYLTTGAFNLNISTSTSSVNPLSVIATTGVGIKSVVTSGTAGRFEATSGFGVWAQSNTSVPLIVASNPATTNTVDNITTFYRQSSGTAANGIGMSISLQPQTSTGSQPIANEIISKWTNATHATRTSQYIVTGTNNAVTADLFTLSGSGETRLNKYGVGSFTAGTEVYLAAFKADGTIMEFPAGGLPGGGALITADEGITANTATNVRLGSANNSGVPFAENRFINTSTFGLTFNSANVSNTTTSSALVFTGNSLTSGTGFYLSSTSLSSGSLIDVSVASTAAASDLQKGINVSLSGANGTSGQTSYGIYSSNAHSGTLSESFGVYGTASNATLNVGVYGQINSTSGVSAGVYAINSAAGYGLIAQSAGGGTAGNFTSTTGYGVDAVSGGQAIRGTTTGVSFGVTGATAGSDVSTAILAFPAVVSNNIVANGIELRAQGNSGAAANFGVSLNYDLADDGQVIRPSGRIYNQWITSTAASRLSQTVITAYSVGVEATLMKLRGDGSIVYTPMTATAASALTPAEGMFVFVSNTNGTFTSIGPWMYYNAAWHAL